MVYSVSNVPQVPSSSSQSSSKTMNPSLAKFLTVISQIARGALLGLIILAAAATGFSFGGGIVVLFNGGLTISLIIGSILGAGGGATAGYFFNKLLKPGEASM